MTPLSTSGPAQPDITGRAGHGQGTTTAAVLLFAGFAGFGAGAVDLATASSLLLSPAGGFAVAGGVAASVWGTSLLAWTVLSLQRGRLMLARTATALLLGASLIHALSAVAAMAAGPSGLALSHLAALLLSLMIVAAAGWLKRRSEAFPATGVPTADSPRAGRLLLAAFASAVLVAGVATPGLAASTAGQYAVPHGQHGLPGVGSHHGH